MTKDFVNAGQAKKAENLHMTFELVAFLTFANLILDKNTCVFHQQQILIASYNLNIVNVR